MAVKSNLNPAPAKPVSKSAFPSTAIAHRRLTLHPELRGFTRNLYHAVAGRFGEGLAGEVAKQRATKVPAGGVPVAVGCHRASELKWRMMRNSLKLDKRKR